MGLIHVIWLPVMSEVKRYIFKNWLLNILSARFSKVINNQIFSIFIKCKQKQKIENIHYVKLKVIVWNRVECADCNILKLRQ